jgi:hypothetical protein
MVRDAEISISVRLATISCFCSLPQSPPCKQDKFNRTLWKPQFEISALLGYYAACGGNSYNVLGQPIGTIFKGQKIQDPWIS